MGFADIEDQGDFLSDTRHARGVDAVTARLSVNYRRPVKVDHAALVRARVTADDPPLYRLDSLLVQEGEVRASASGTFMRRE